MDKSNFIRLIRSVIVLVLTATPLVISASTAAAVNMDKWVGTWILNIQKSRYGDGKPPVDPAALRQVVKIRVANGTLDLYARTELADGTDVADETHLLDLTGKPHVTELTGFKAVTETFKQVDANTFEITLKARPAEPSDVPDGELTIQVRFTMSADGNTIRETKEYRYKEFVGAQKSTSSDERNPAEGTVLVFDKQR
jgi:hypothetical protein